MLLSIIIVSYNTKDLTVQCIETVLESKPTFEYEIIVVDNASKDGSADVIERDFPTVKLLRNSENLMFAKANNQAAESAQGEYLLLLNSDTIVEPGNMEKMVDFASSSDQIGCVGPRVLNTDRTIQSEGGQFDSYMNAICNAFLIHEWPLPRLLKKLILPLGFPSGLEGLKREVGWVSGCCMLTGRDTFLKCGGLDEALPFYFGDNEYCYRLRLQGLSTWVVPNASIIHVGGASCGQPFADWGDEYSGSTDQFIFYEKSIGAKKKVAINRLRKLLYSGLLPLVWLFNRKMVKVVKSKIAYVTQETDYFVNQSKSVK